MIYKIIVLILIAAEVMYLGFSYKFPLSQQKRFVLSYVFKSEGNTEILNSSPAYNPTVIKKIAGIDKSITNWGVIENTYRGVVLSVEGDTANISKKSIKISITGLPEGTSVFVISRTELPIAKVFVMRRGEREEGSFGQIEVGDIIDVRERLRLNKRFPEARELLEFTVGRG